MAAGALPFLRRIAADGVGSWVIAGCWGAGGGRGACATATRCRFDRRAATVGSVVAEGELGLASFLRFRALGGGWAGATGDSEAAAGRLDEAEAARLAA